MWYQNPTQICDVKVMTGTEMAAISPSLDPDPFNSKKKPSDTKKTERLPDCEGNHWLQHDTRGKAVLKNKPALVTLLMNT